MAQITITIPDNKATEVYESTLRQFPNNDGETPRNHLKKVIIDQLKQLVHNHRIRVAKESVDVSDIAS